jgi:hypothetical protein
MGTKDVPRVACFGLTARNFIDWRQSMSGCSGVAFPGLRLVEGIVTVEQGGAHSSSKVDIVFAHFRGECMDRPHHRSIEGAEHLD